ncbi:ketopantoate reductase family protein, partial [Frankia sp. CcWB2]
MSTKAGAVAGRNIVELTGLSIAYTRRGGRLRRWRTISAVEDVDFTIAPGQTVAVVGESGSGKTIAMGLGKPTSGRIHLDEQDITSAGWSQLRPLRRRFQFVHQNPFSSLDPRSTVGESIAEPLVSFRVGDRASRAARARELLDQLAHEVAVLRAGRIVENGPAADVLTAPTQDHTRELLGAIPGQRFAAAPAAAPRKGRTMSRRYIVIGAGAVGATVAVELRLAGIDVVVVARGANLAALRAGGLRYIRPPATPGGEPDERRIPLDVVGGPDEVDLRGDDVLVLATKSQDSEALLAQWAWRPVDADADGTRRTAAEALPVVLLQNGIENARTALRRFATVIDAVVL